LVYDHIWLNLPRDYCHFFYIFLWKITSSTLFFLAKFHQMASPHKVIQHPLVKFGGFWLSNSPYYNTINSRASRLYDHTKEGNHKRVEPIPSKVVGIHFVIHWCWWLTTSHPPPLPSPLHFLKLTNHLFLPYVNFYCHACLLPIPINPLHNVS